MARAAALMLSGLNRRRVSGPHISPLGLTYPVALWAVWEPAAQSNYGQHSRALARPAPALHCRGRATPSQPPAATERCSDRPPYTPVRAAKPAPGPGAAIHLGASSIPGPAPDLTPPNRPRAETMHHDINLIIGPDDPTPVATASDTAADGRVVLRLPGLAMYGTADQLMDWLRAGRDALLEHPRANVTPLFTGSDLLEIGPDAS